jgi:ribosomal protein S18 acetylase RimI-like enzyme
MGILKKATLADLVRVQQLGIETYREHFSDIWSARALDNYLDQQFGTKTLTVQLEDPDIQYYIPFHNEDALGIIKIKYDSEQPAPPFDRGFELEKIYLLNKFTGRGLGSLMLSEIIGIAQAHKETFIWLDVLKSNLRAKKLYEEQGFKTAGEIAFSTDLTNIGMWVMRKDLIQKKV